MTFFYIDKTIVDRRFYDKHMITRSVALKLYTIYSPPNHHDGVVHHAYVDAAERTTAMNTSMVKRLNKYLYLRLDDYQ